MSGVHAEDLQQGVGKDWEGRFWVPEEPDRVIDGILTLPSIGAPFRLALNGDLRREAGSHWVRRGQGLAYEDNPRSDAADTRPAVVHGVLGETAVTALDSFVVERDVPLFAEETGQTLRISQLLLGSHVDPASTPIGRARVRLPRNAHSELHGDGLFPLLQLDRSSPCEVIAGEATLSTYCQDGWSYIELSLARPTPERDWDRILFASIAAFLRLWTGNSQLWTGRHGPQLAQCEVCTSDSHWCPIVTSQREPANWPGHLLLKPTRLDHDTIRRWIDLDRRIAPLGDVIGRNLVTGMPLEAAALVAVSSLEGFHRATAMSKCGYPPPFLQLVPEAVRPQVKSELNKLLADAAAPGDQTAMDKAVKKLLAGSDGTSLADRLRMCADEATAVAPGLCGPQIDEWVSLAVDIRNAQAHQQRAGHHFTLADAHDHLRVARSATWIGRILVLQRLGIEPADLRNALAGYHPFLYDLATLDEHLDDGTFSHLTTFQTACGG